MRASVKGWLWFACVIASVPAGCGSSSTSRSAPISATQACRQLHAARGQRIARCWGGPLASWRMWDDSQEDCSGYDKHVAEGRIDYRQAELAACLASFERPCDDLSPYQNSCVYEILRGLVPDGQHCQEAAVCGPVSGCLKVNALTCGEVCVSGGTLNQSCGLYCGGTTPCLDIPFCTPGLTCLGDVCVQGRPAGDACTAVEPFTCLPPLHCSADPNDLSSTGVCTAPVVGGPCRQDGDCFLGEFCLQGTCSQRRTVGASCADAPSGCAYWATCSDTTRTCITAGGAGQRCAEYPGSPEYLICTSGGCENDVCQPTARPGESCATTTCPARSSCDETALICVACPP